MPIQNTKVSVASTDDYREIFVSGRPLLDLRAPVEFARGAFPGATNLPLMTDDERAAVGTRYKQQGQQAAIELGHQLVSGTTREARMAAWLKWCKKHPDGRIYCFRGGLRSATVGAWLAAAGARPILVEGGYKALRRYLLEQLETLAQALDLLLICGRTGTGKTLVIEALPQALDLEGRARHRGSAFGASQEPQPAQIGFENAVAVDLLRLQAAGFGSGARPVVLEDEGRLIGRCLVPPTLQDRMKAIPRVIVDEPLDARVGLIIRDYIQQPLAAMQHNRSREEALDQLEVQLRAALDRIRRRLGGSRHQDLAAAMADAFHQHRQQDSDTGHATWIAPLLTDYYDPMYDYMLKQRQGPVLFQGSRSAVLQWLSDQRSVNQG